MQVYAKHMSVLHRSHISTYMYLSHLIHTTSHSHIAASESPGYCRVSFLPPAVAGLSIYLTTHTATNIATTVTGTARSDLQRTTCPANVYYIAKHAGVHVHITGLASILPPNQHCSTCALSACPDPAHSVIPAYPAHSPAQPIPTAAQWLTAGPSILGCGCRSACSVHIS